MTFLDVSDDNITQGKVVSLGDVTEGLPRGRVDQTTLQRNKIKLMFLVSRDERRDNGVMGEHRREEDNVNASSSREGGGEGGKGERVTRDQGIVDTYLLVILITKVG